MEKILVINPGSTSTKIAVFEDETKVLSETLRHEDEILEKFQFVMEQVDYRKQLIADFLKEKDIDASSFTCVMARGGMIPFVPFGGFAIDQKMVDYLSEMREGSHVSNIACVIAYGFAQELGIPAYIYAPVYTDELSDVARVTGIPEIKKQSRGHALNSHAMATHCAHKILNKPLSDCNIIVLHMGGGGSMWLFEKGHAVDMYSDDDAFICPERCGKIQAIELVKLCYSGQFTYAQMMKKMRGNAGIRALLGTSDMRIIEERVLAGEEEANRVYDAFIYGCTKAIGDLAVVVKGKVDRIVLTGGVAYSKLFCDRIEEMVSWIAPVERMGGEYEMEALAEGGLRILRGEEKPREVKYN